MPERLALVLSLALLFAGAALFAGGCGDARTAGEPAHAPGGSSPDGSAAPGALPGSSETEAAARAAVAFLATKLSIPPGQIAVASAEPVSWPDTSLGCPQPGMAYAQVVTAGYRMVLSVAGQSYEVHTDRTGRQVAMPGPDSRRASSGAAW